MRLRLPQPHPQPKDDPDARPKRRPYEPSHKPDRVNMDNFQWTGEAAQVGKKRTNSRQGDYQQWLREREAEVKQRLASTPFQEFVYAGGGTWVDKTNNSFWLVS